MGEHLSFTRFHSAQRSGEAGLTLDPFESSSPSLQNAALAKDTAGTWRYLVRPSVRVEEEGRAEGGREAGGWSWSCTAAAARTAAVPSRRRRRRHRGRPAATFLCAAADAADAADSHINSL